MRIHYYFILFCLLIAPSISSAHSGGLDFRGGHHCWTNCESYSLRTGQYHFHPEKMDSEQLEGYERFKGRLCERVVRRFSDDHKMWKRVNDRIDNRFGFVCE